MAYSEDKMVKIDQWYHAEFIYNSSYTSTDLSSVDFYISINTALRIILNNEELYALRIICISSILIYYAINEF